MTDGLLGRSFDFSIEFESDCESCSIMTVVFEVLSCGLGLCISKVSGVLLKFPFIKFTFVQWPDCLRNMIWHGEY